MTVPVESDGGLDSDTIQRPEEGTDDGEHTYELLLRSRPSTQGRRRCEERNARHETGGKNRLTSLDPSMARSKGEKSSSSSPRSRGRMHARSGSPKSADMRSDMLGLSHRSRLAEGASPESERRRETDEPGGLLAS